MVDFKLMERIKKVKALADRADNVHEAAAAASMLSNLLMNHQLSMRDIESADVRSRYVQEDRRTGYQRQWARSLYAVIARNNFCEIVYYPRSDKVSVVGEPDNIETTQQMYDWLKIELFRLAESGWLNDGKGSIDKIRTNVWGEPVYVKRTSAKQWKNSFLLGAVHETDKILRAQRQQFVNVNNASALVIDKQAELDRMSAEMFGRTKTAPNSKVHGEAFSAGQQAAGSVNYNKHVGGGNLALGRGK
jgi:hypothetical protein